ncbi:hypothetical protein GCK72_007085 [Caenorhabditis remanei]|uniref:Uncharacterized protein n=1 Tax=Caenorhabditis remanei TaxID=31234 RepID=A0A6A5HKN9_CAERE|nr:hypothetical protein GCK72_007085 [Caenorhabditis remanei]KAF1767127.1 hypothetical protein GCK72_007085 [Caenorhabditis remanei]
MNQFSKLRQNESSREDLSDSREAIGTEKDPIVIEDSVEKPRDYSHVVFKKGSFGGSQASVETTPPASSQPIVAPVRTLFEAPQQPVRRRMLSGGRTAADPEIYEKEAKAKALRRRDDAARKVTSNVSEGCERGEKEEEEKNEVETEKEEDVEEKEEEKEEDAQKKMEAESMEKKKKEKNKNERMRVKLATSRINQETDEFQLECAEKRHLLATIKEDEFIKDSQEEKDMEEQIRKIKKQTQKRRLNQELKKKEDAKKDEKEYETIRKLKEEAIKMEKKTARLQLESARLVLEKAEKEKKEMEKSLKKRRDDMEEDSEDGGQPGLSNRLTRQPSGRALAPGRCSSISRNVKKELEEEKVEKKNLKRRLQVEDVEDLDEDQPGSSSQEVTRSPKSPATPNKKPSSPRKKSLKKAKKWKTDDVYKKVYPNKATRYNN